ncbi:restriction endonuclease subunit S [Acinetobacter ursingii]|jgi:type I restriction enzyme S subunit|uniref:Restriction endonuclease subunit S n=1 Tax=Acinetobacter haemolyticus TaxID=29430 RepID=A0A857ILG9_ACIHA|nr:restriction endonuclease subunit S [Acinetobacter haemolyticus]EKV4706863.1 restriction endonuclease subunit S [Acinetobacter baumannii]QHI10642.1 restriction endonuclease subunit S [Acinetobacter haemolyticus]QHI13912.1 restriction endonuclease subunit S [Acinetobacter haemolyticus]QNY28281.1 restriction endonuclease subunit S [Acinetobacter seifertii]
MTQIVKIGNISTQIRGVSYSKNDAISNMQEGYLPVLRANNIQEQGLILEDFVYVPESKISEKQRILAGDVLIAASSGSISLVGKAASAKEDIDAGFGAFCKILRPNTELVDPRYFANYFQTQKYRQIISNLAAGANINNLKNEHLDDLEIPLPPLSEQRRIASILDQADVLRQKRQQAIEKLDQLLQATFIDMFGDPVSNPKGFEVKKLSEQVDLIQIGPFGTQLHQEDYIENGIPLINPSHIKNGKIIPNHKLTVSQSKYEELTQYHLRLNDVLLGRRGEMGRCAVVTQNEVGWLCGTGSLFLRPNLEKINPFFLELLLSSDSIKRYLENVSQGQTMANLNKTIVGTIPLISPSIEIQNKFFLIAEKIDKMKTELKSAKNQVNNLFESLQNQAFNGTL